MLWSRDQPWHSTASFGCASTWCGARTTAGPGSGQGGAPEGHSPALHRRRSRSRPRLRFVGTRYICGAAGERAHSELLPPDPRDVSTVPTVRLANGLRGILREPALRAQRHLVHLEARGPSPERGVSARVAATHDSTREP